MSARAKRPPGPAFSLTPVAAAHVAQALQLHRKWAIERGLSLPAELLQFHDLMTATARSRQAPPSVDPPTRPRDRGGVAPLTVTYEEAAAALSISKRSVERLVSSGELPAVRFRRSSRVRVADLTRYIDSQEGTCGAQ